MTQMVLAALDMSHLFCESAFDKVFKSIDKGDDGALNKDETKELLEKIIHPEPKKKVVKIIRRVVKPAVYHLDLDGKVIRVRQ